MHLPPGRCWRIAPVGTTEVYLNRYLEDGTASVNSRVLRGWAKMPMRVSAKDLFATRAEATREYKRRKAQALETNRNASLNFCTELP